MRNTRDLRIRAETCVGCHVGAPAADGLPARNVNHDLIAAGHPRLNFEYGAYLANLPRHWDPGADRRRHADHEARAWAIGQEVSAHAALVQLAARAKQAEPPQHGEAANPSGAWPEFSEYDCFACHHDLRDPSYRRQLAARPQRGHALGTLPWGTWYFTEIPFFPAADFDELRTAMGRPYPELAKVRELTEQLAKKLSVPIETSDKFVFTPEVLRVAMDHIAEHYTATNWDEAAQAYLALVALNAARRDLSPADKPPPRQKEIDKALAELQDLLKFPIVKADDKKPAATLHFDSPRDFDPVQCQAAMERLRQLFRAEEH